MLKEQIEVCREGRRICADQRRIDRVQRRNRSILRARVGNALFTLLAMTGCAACCKYLFAYAGLAL